MLLSEGILQIQHTDFYIKSGNGTSIVRNIYENVEYDDYENQQISYLKEAIQASNLKINLKQSILLKMLVVAQYDVQKALNNCIQHKEFLHKFKKQDFSKEFDKGRIYTYGLDKQQRPIIIINDIISVEIASHFLEAVKRNLLIPYYVENWTLIIDLDKDLPVMQMEDLQDLQLHFCGNLNKIIILNGPIDIEQIVDQFTMKFKFLKQKIKIIDDLVDLQQYINKEQLEIKYGGDAPNCTSFWPIIKRDTQSNGLLNLKQGSHLSMSLDQSPRKGSFMKIQVYEENGNTLFGQQVELAEEEQQQKEQQKQQPMNVSVKYEVKHLNQEDAIKDSDDESVVSDSKVLNGKENNTSSKNYNAKTTLSTQRQTKIIMEGEREMPPTTASCCSRSCQIF